jgi:hypothetical protein
LGEGSREALKIPFEFQAQDFSRTFEQLIDLPDERKLQRPPTIPE